MMAKGNISVQIWKTVIIVSIAQICYKLTKDKLNCKFFDIYNIYNIYIYYTYIYIIYNIYILCNIYIYTYNLLVNLYIWLTISSCYGSITLTLGLIGEMVVWALCVIVVGLLVSRRCWKGFLALAISAPRMA